MLINIGSANMFTRTTCTPTRECTTQNYLNMFERYKEVYAQVYPGETMPAVPTNHLAGALGSYTGDLKEIVRVFMEVIYVKFFLTQSQGGSSDHEAAV